MSVVDGSRIASDDLIFRRLFGVTVGGWLLARQAAAAARRLEQGAGDTAYLKAKIATARFYAEQLMPPAKALLGPITRGADLLYAVDEDRFGS